MVNPEQRRARYVVRSEGAPPVPPPGGYRGARRQPEAFAQPAAPGPTAHQQTDPRSSGMMGWIALVTAILFAVVLIGALIATSTDTLYSVLMLTLQLVVLGVVIAALFAPRSRRLGAIALVVTLLVNVPVIGAVSALRTSASGSYSGTVSDARQHELDFPGIKGVQSSAVLSQKSLEEAQRSADDTLKAVRERLSAEFGYTWTQAKDVVLRPERNGYGGESMLVQYTSTTWATEEPVQDNDRKREVMDVIAAVLSEQRMNRFLSLNEPGSGLDAATLAKLYGSSDPEKQETWEWYADDFPAPLRFYATVHDLSKDLTGDFTRSRQAQSARTGEPAEGLQLMVIARQLLSEDDVDEFTRRMDEYPGQ